VLSALVGCSRSLSLMRALYVWPLLWVLGHAFCLRSSSLTPRRSWRNCVQLKRDTVTTGTSLQSLDLLRCQILERKKQLSAIEQEIDDSEKELYKLEQEYGSEINRVRKEFARMKERSYEEAAAAVYKARVDAIREILPVGDNYTRAKKVFEPLVTQEEQEIADAYDKLFTKFNEALERFGVMRVESLGQPFDVRFMEAIMTAPSAEYARDVVCNEYQVGYRVGETCVRPAMVVVSLGPGPS
jgi:molecular chaperone GrpE